jgi:hypothetical protein
LSIDKFPDQLIALPGILTALPGPKFVTNTSAIDPINRPIMTKAATIEFVRLAGIIIVIMLIMLLQIV